MLIGHEITVIMSCSVSKTSWVTGRKTL